MNKKAHAHATAHDVTQRRAVLRQAAESLGMRGTLVLVGAAEQLPGALVKGDLRGVAQARAISEGDGRERRGILPVHRLAGSLRLSPRWR